jgi:two-component system, LuxR family, response regulator FixJ
MVDAKGSKTRKKSPALSPREHQVLRYLASGKSNREISLELGISIKTVETHRSRIMLKIQAPSLVHLVHYAIRHKIVELQG